jgi:peptidase M28-like protein
VLLLVALLFQPVAAAPLRTADEVSQIGRQFTSDSQAYELLEELTSSIGQRLTASPNGVAAEEFVFNKLRKFGYNDVRYETFPITAWQRGALELQIDGKSIPAAALAYSPVAALFRSFFSWVKIEGLVGSRAYVNAMASKHALEKIKYMINTDMSVNPTGYNLWGGDPDLEFFGQLAEIVRKYYPPFSDGPTTNWAAGSQSTDSQPFLQHGIPIAYPTATWTDDVRRCTHADCDRINIVSRADMEKAAGVGAMLLVALADAGPLPAHVMDASEVDAYYQEYGLKQ